MLPANGSHPLELIPDVIEGVVQREWLKPISRVWLYLGFGCIHYGIYESGVLFFGNTERLPSSSWPHSSLTSPSQEYLIGDMKRREDAAGIKIRDVENEPEKAALAPS